MRDTKNTSRDNTRELNTLDFDQFLRSLMGVALLLLIVRILFTFFLAFIFSQKWHVEWIFYEWIPIVAFNAEASIFAKINGWSLLATAFTIFVLFLAHSLRQKTYNEYKIWALYMGVLMVFVQYIILYSLRNYIHFGVQGGLWMSFFLLSVGASGILYVRQKTH